MSPCFPAKQGSNLTLLRSGPGQGGHPRTEDEQAGRKSVSYWGQVCYLVFRATDSIVILAITPR